MDFYLKQHVIEELISQGALFVINHSGGKDSQAMTIYLRKIIPPGQLLIVHAHLPGVEWPGIVSHIVRTIGNTRFIKTWARKTFFEMVLRRKMFPSVQFRQCTSDLKRGPIEKVIRRFTKEHGFSVVVNCMGMRAEESTARAKKEVFKLNNRNSVNGRTWYDWLPIHRWKVDEVFKCIAGAEQKPHWAYGKGMSRLSCCFCIMASKTDLKTAAGLMPKLYKKYCDLEKEINHALLMPGKTGVKFLPEVIKGV